MIYPLGISFCIEPYLMFFTSEGLVSAFGYHVPFVTQTYFTSDVQKETATPKGIKGLSRPKISLRPLSGNVMKRLTPDRYPTGSTHLRVDELRNLFLSE